MKHKFRDILLQFVFNNVVKPPAIAWQRVLSWSGWVISANTIIRSVLARGIRPPIIIPLQCYDPTQTHFIPAVLLRLLSIVELVVRWL